MPGKVPYSMLLQMEKGYNTPARNNTICSLKTSRFNDASRNYDMKGTYNKYLKCDRK